MEEDDVCRAQTEGHAWRIADDRRAFGALWLSRFPSNLPPALKCLMYQLPTRIRSGGVSLVRHATCPGL
jgi:hypothetical protein